MQDKEERRYARLLRWCIAAIVLGTLMQAVSAIWGRG